MANSKISKAFKAAVVSSVLVASPVPLSNVATASYANPNQLTRRDQLLSRLKSALENAKTKDDKDLIKELNDLIDKVGDSKKAKSNQLKQLESTVDELVNRATAGAQLQASAAPQTENGDNQHSTPQEPDVFTTAPPPRPDTVQPAEQQTPAEQLDVNNAQPAEEDQNEVQQPENEQLDNSEASMENSGENTANQLVPLLDSINSSEIAEYNSFDSENNFPNGSPTNQQKGKLNNSILYQSEGSVEPLAVNNDQLPETPAELNTEESSGSNSSFTTNTIEYLSDDKNYEQIICRADRHDEMCETYFNDSPLTIPADQQPEEETQNEPPVEPQAENQENQQPANEIEIEEEDNSSSPTPALNENADEQHNEEEAQNETEEAAGKDEQIRQLEAKIKELQEQLAEAQQNTGVLNEVNEHLENYVAENTGDMAQLGNDLGNLLDGFQEFVDDFDRSPLAQTNQPQRRQQPETPVTEQNENAKPNQPAENKIYADAETQTDVNAEKLNQLKEKLIKAEQDMYDLEMKNKELAVAVNCSKQSKDDASRAAIEANQKLENQERRIQQLQNKLKEANKKINNLTTQNTFSEIVIKSKTECLEEQNKAKLEADLKIQTLQKELDEAKKKLDAAEEAKQRAELSAKAKEEEAINMANEKESSLKNEIQKLKDQIKDLQEQLQAATQNEQQINDLQAQINALNLQLNQAQNNQVEFQGTQPLPPANDQAETQNETPAEPQPENQENQQSDQDDIYSENRKVSPKKADGSEEEDFYEEDPDESEKQEEHEVENDNEEPKSDENISKKDNDSDKSNTSDDDSKSSSYSDDSSDEDSSDKDGGHKDGGDSSTTNQPQPQQQSRLQRFKNYLYFNLAALNRPFVPPTPTPTPSATPFPYKTAAPKLTNNDDSQNQIDNSQNQHLDQNLFIKYIYVLLSLGRNSK